MADHGDLVSYEADGGIVTIALNRPEKLNAFNAQLVLALKAALRRFAATCRSLAMDVASGRLTPDQIDEETLGSRLGTAGRERTLDFYTWAGTTGRIGAAIRSWVDLPGKTVRP